MRVAHISAFAFGTVMGRTHSALSSLFPGFYRPSKEQVAAAWRSGTVVLDTNVLLDLYKLPQQSREEVQAVLSEISAQIWVPHHVALEFEFGRLRIIEREQQRLAGVISDVQRASRSIADSIDGMLLERRGITANSDALKKGVDSAVKNVLAKLEEARRAHFDPKKDDGVRAFVGELLSGRVGQPFQNQGALNELYVLGEQRYSMEQPPGFRDEKTGSFVAGGLRYERRYGDLIMWKQLLEHVKTFEGSSDLIFVTGERKDDWWTKDASGHRMPHYELVSEYAEHASGGVLLMYSLDTFVNEARTQRKAKVSSTALHELKEITSISELVDGREHLREATSLESWIYHNVHAGLERNQTGRIPTFLPKYDRSAPAYQIIEVQAITDDESVFRLLDQIRLVREEMQEQDRRFALIFLCPSRDYADWLPPRLEKYLPSGPNFFVWRTRTGVQGVQQPASRR